MLSKICLLLFLMRQSTSEPSNICEIKTTTAVCRRPTTTSDELVILPATTTDVTIVGFSEYEEKFKLLKNLPHLENIHIQGPEIESLPNHPFFLSNVKRVRVVTTNITRVPQSLLLNTTITSLQLLHNIRFNLDLNTAMLTSDLLKDLSLKRCLITHVGKESFSKLPNLETLDLHFNLLVSLPLGVFSNNKKLRTLDLSDNMFTSIDSKALPLSIEHVNLINNYWECDCSLLHVMTRFKEPNRQARCMPTRRTWDDAYPELLMTCKPENMEIRDKTEEDLGILEEEIKLAKKLSEQETVVGPYGNSVASKISVRIAAVLLFMLLASL